MSRERDLKPGIDVTPLASVSQQNVQDLVAFAEAAPNKAMIIYDYATPDIINNPRYTRYLWFDRNHSTVKYYNGSNWVAIAGGTGGDSNVTVDEIDKGTGANGAILRINPTSGIVEFAPLDNILTTGTINLNAIKLTGGANGYILSIIGGVVSWQSANAIVAQVLNAITSIDPNKLAGKIPNSVLFSNVFSEAEWLDILTFLAQWPTGVIPLYLINTSGATDGQVIRFNSVSGVPEWGAGASSAVGLSKVFVADGIYSDVIDGEVFYLPTARDTFDGIPFTNTDTALGRITFLHNFGILPKLAQFFFVTGGGSVQVPLDQVYALKTDSHGNTFKIEPAFRITLYTLSAQITCQQTIEADTALNQSDIYYYNTGTTTEVKINRKDPTNIIRCHLYA